ncbi:MAG TPA: hypothetical protein VII02_07200 [Gemmatimonadaceae bacterium]
MRSSLFRRTFWLAFSLWFGPSIVVPELLDHCPVHHFTAGLALLHAGHSAMDGHSGRLPDHASHKGCTCLDQGCRTNAATLPAAAARAFGSVQLFSVNKFPSDRDRHPVTSAEFLLPLTTGPPPRA